MHEGNYGSGWLGLGDEGPGARHYPSHGARLVMSLPWLCNSVNDHLSTRVSTLPQASLQPLTSPSVSLWRVPVPALTEVNCHHPHWRCYSVCVPRQPVTSQTEWLAGENTI